MSYSSIRCNFDLAQLAADMRAAEEGYSSKAAKMNSRALANSGRLSRREAKRIQRRVARQNSVQPESVPASNWTVQQYLRSNSELRNSSEAELQTAAAELGISL